MMSSHQPNEEANRGNLPQRPGGMGVKAGIVVLTFLAAVACMGFSRWLYRPVPTTLTPRTSLKLPNQLFVGWPKRNPDFVLVLSGQEHGYLLPCGCSRPQKGGLERRYNFLQILRDKGWPVLAVDLGDIAQSEAPVEQLPNIQQIIKYTYSMRALKAMDYTAVGLGPIEANNLFPLYGQYALQGEKPDTLAANLHSRLTEFQPGIEDWVQATPKGTDIKIGVTSIAGAWVSSQRPKDDKIQFDFGGDTLRALQAKVQKADFRVLLYEGYTNRGKNQKPEVVACAEAFPDYQVVVALSETDEPPGAPLLANRNKTMIITLGHKGKYVGVVGVFKTGNKDEPYALYYQLVELGEEYITPKAEENDQPIGKLMEQYTKELKDQDYLAKYVQRKHPLQVPGAFPGQQKPEFVGSEACKQCHAPAFQIWGKSAHSHAYKTLVDAKRPSNRQYDPECIVCHTVGFGYDTGFTEEKKTDILQNVGCESCHGPCGGHILDAKNKQWHNAINPWKYRPQNVNKNRQIEDMCIKCHDHENDVNWTGPNAFTARWQLIQHYNQPKPAPAVPPPAAKQK
jgi:Cytochrome c554 and c-prime